jgi:hypothetical protein
LHPPTGGVGRAANGSFARGQSVVGIFGEKFEAAPL